MKNQIKQFALAIMIIPGLAWASPQPPIEGKFELVSRVCSDGSAPKDRFVIGRDKLQLRGFADSDGVIVLRTINGELDTYGVYQDPSKGQLIVDELFTIEPRRSLS